MHLFFSARLSFTLEVAQLNLIIASLRKSNKEWLITSDMARCDHDIQTRR